MRVSSTAATDENTCLPVASTAYRTGHGNPFGTEQKQCQRPQQQLADACSLGGPPSSSGNQPLSKLRADLDYLTTSNSGQQLRNKDSHIADEQGSTVSLSFD